MGCGFTIFSWNSPKCSAVSSGLIKIKCYRYLIMFQVFHEKKHEDEEVLSQETNIDFNSPEDLIDAIQSKVCILYLTFIDLKNLNPFHVVRKHFNLECHLYIPKSMLIAILNYICNQCQSPLITQGFQSFFNNRRYFLNFRRYLINYAEGCKGSRGRKLLKYSILWTKKCTSETAKH